MTMPWWGSRAVYAVLYGIACWLTWRLHANETSLMLAWVILFFDVPLRLWRYATTAERVSIAFAVLLPLVAIKMTDIVVAFAVGVFAIALIASVERRIAVRTDPPA
jgi:hypothetical protein